MLSYVLEKRPAPDARRYDLVVRIENPFDERLPKVVVSWTCRLPTGGCDSIELATTGDEPIEALGEREFFLTEDRMRDVLSMTDSVSSEFYEIEVRVDGEVRLTIPGRLLGDWLNRHF